MDQRIHAEGFPNTESNAGIPISGSQGAVRAWRFQGFEFDLRRGELHGPDGAAIALRPKTESLLRQFLAQPGRLFSRDELMAAVWPKAVVTDDSLVQCVGELRAALGDPAQRLICTLPRRGYRLDAAVVPVNDPTDAVSPPREPSRWPQRRVLAVTTLVAIVVAASAAAFHLRMAIAPFHIDEVVASRATVAVMPFVVGAHEPSLRPAADAMADAIAAQLATRLGMRGIGRSAIQDFDAGSPPYARLANDLKATHVVIGRFTPHAEDGGFSVDVHIASTANGEVFWAKHFESAGPGAATMATDVGQHVVVAMRKRGPLEAGRRAAQPGHTADAADLALMGWGDLDVRKSLADVRRARERFEAALRVDAQSVIAMNGLSTSYAIERNDPMGAPTPAQIAEHERVAEMASKLAPDNDTSLVQWGTMQILRGRPDLALPAFEKANRLVPSQPGAYTHRALAYLLLGRTAEVQPLTERAVELGVGNARLVSPAYLIAAEAALMRGEDERARDLASSAVAELPSNARAHATLAAIDALSGRDELAAAELAEFRKLWPSATVERYDDLRPSTHPVYRAQRARLYDGLRKAGLPER